MKTNNSINYYPSDLVKMVMGLLNHHRERSWNNHPGFRILLIGGKIVEDQSRLRTEEPEITQLVHFYLKIEKTHFDLIV